jgi:hypothetical protein
VQTRSPVYTAKFEHDGTYQLRVVAIDRYGVWSEPRDIGFNVALRQPDPLLNRLIPISTGLATTGVLYVALIFPLILLYPHFSWARTAANSGAFTKFPILHKTILDTRWARERLFRQYVDRAPSPPQ